MLTKADACNPTFALKCNQGDAARWSRIAQALLRPATSKQLNESHIRKTLGDECFHAFIRVLERPTNRTAVILWRSPGRCYYADQLWVRGIAGKGGRCALSGQSVERGDYIYRPRQGKFRTLNAYAIILANAIEIGSITDT